MLLQDDRLIDTMREFVTAANRLQYLSLKGHLDLHQIEEASETHRQASSALQEALVSRGWRRPGE
ncbi:MAG TPA: hypothetical protein VMZ11_05280 [Mycobacteriales bacterium]|nr:hypothetical protein [Mycobacteriales bacterium]